MNGMNHFERNLARPRIQHVVFVDSHVFKALLPPLIGHPPSQIVVAFRSCWMRFGREVTMKIPELLGRSERPVALLERLLLLSAARGETEYRVEGQRIARQSNATERGN